MSTKTLDDFVGNTPLVKLQRMNPNPSNTILLKLEGNNPAGSVKDRPVYSMISRAEARGEIKPGDTLIEATSGNTGIALAMVAAMRGYKLVLVMPENQSIERRQSMKAYGAELVLTPKDGSMELARDVAMKMQAEGEGIVLDQFGNQDNPLAHYEGTGPEIWRDTAGKITHFVSSMGTTGTIMGVSKFLKEQNPAIRIIGVPTIYDGKRVDELRYVSQKNAENITRKLATEEGIFAGISSGGGLYTALQLSKEVKDAVIVSIVCDRGDRYLSTGVFPS